VSSSGNHNAAPPVRIIGGGGSGAAATAHVKKGQLTDIAVASAGHHYVAPALVILSGADPTTIAQAAVRVEEGKVAAIAVLDGGAGYARAPEVRISGGRLPGGRDATASAAIVGGQVVGLEVTDPGAGYVPPLAVVVAPGAPVWNAIPVWAPAGALSSTLRDMARFATAALGRRQVEGRTVPVSLTRGFHVSQRPYACASDTPALATCQASQYRSALAWRFYPPDPEHRMPSMLGKNGALPGFSAEVVLMPGAQLAVVALTNSNSFLNANGVADVVAEPIAFNVLQAMLQRRSR
jgi:CubicO group peptidase (beta-lactamase class C family)